MFDALRGSGAPDVASSLTACDATVKFPRPFISISSPTLIIQGLLRNNDSVMYDHDRHDQFNLYSNRAVLTTGHLSS
jgi:hypothetical protein